MFTPAKQVIWISHMDFINMSRQTNTNNTALIKIKFGGKNLRLFLEKKVRRMDRLEFRATNMTVVFCTTDYVSEMYITSLRQRNVHHVGLRRLKVNTA